MLNWLPQPSATPARCLTLEPGHHFFGYHDIHRSSVDRII